MQSEYRKYGEYYTQLRNKYIYKDKTNEIDAKKLKRMISQIKTDSLYLKKKKETGMVEELNFYHHKFQQLDQLLKNHKKKNQKSYVENEAKNLFSEEKLEKRSLKKSNEASKSQKQLRSFFEKKKQAGQGSTFSDWLEQPKISSNRSFKTKIESNNNEITRLRRENMEIEHKIKRMASYQISGLNDEDKIRQIQKRIQELQEENQMLYKENTQIKSQFNSSSNSRPSISSVQEVIVSPYSLDTKENDLYKIEKRNSHSTIFRDILGNPIVPINNRSSNYDTPQFSYKQTLGSQSVYNMSECSENPSMFESYHLGVESKKVASRNKVSFFKNEGVLFRDKNMDIAFKKKYLGQDSDSVILSLYIQNNTDEKQQVNIEYDYQRNYFKLESKQQVFSIEPKKQKKQVLEITLDHKKDDLNSVCEGIIHFGELLHYKFWVPVTFIMFMSYSESANFSFKSTFHQDQSKEIIPNIVFSSPEEMKKHVPIIQLEDNEGLLWGRSKIHEGPIKLKWRDNKIQIKTSEKWIGAVSFILCNFQ